MMILITIILILMGIILIILGNHFETKSQKIRKNKFANSMKELLTYKHTMDFCMGLITTILGVTLAISLTNYDTNKQKIDKTISLLQILDTDLLAYENLIKDMWLPISETEPDKVLNAFSDTSPSPTFVLDIFLSNEMFVTQCSSYTYGSLIDNRRSLNMSINSIESNPSSEIFVSKLKLMHKDIVLTRKIIDTELRFLNGDIRTATDVLNKINELYIETATNFYNDIDYYLN